MSPTLDQFQLDALSALDHSKGRSILADPMGGRKTGTTLSWLAQQPASQRVLIVAPSGVHGHWSREAAKFHPEANVTLGHGTKAKRVAQLENHPDSPWLHIVTYEGMKQDQHHLVKANFHGVVFDEGHRLKGRRTQVALAANAVTKGRLWTICATGTPVLNHAAELWQYLHMLAPSVYPAFWRWAEEHFTIEIRNFKGNRFPTRIIHDYRPGHEERVRNQIAPFLIQRSLEEMFPGQAWIIEPEHVEIAVELSPAERKAYKSLVDHSWADVGGDQVSTSNALDKTTRLTQLISDWGGLFENAEPGAKVAATVELCLDLLERDEKVVVFAKYKDTVNKIVDQLQGKSVTAAPYIGDMDPHDRDVVITAFGKGKLSVIVGTLASLSEGVDGLQHAASNVVMVDRHWTPALNDQAIGRVRRSGQEKRVTVYHVFAEDTIDATITAACLRKTNVIESLKGRPLVDAVYGRV